MLGQQELDLQNVMLQLAVWAGLMAAHQLSWSGYGISALHALAGRSLLAATMTAMTTVMVLAAALAACIPVATLAAVIQYEPLNHSNAMVQHHVNLLSASCGASDLDRCHGRGLLGMTDRTEYSAIDLGVGSISGHGCTVDHELDHQTANKR